jgi:hypothetical protein
LIVARADEEKKTKKGANVRTIKYMGSSDERYLNATDDFGGQLQGGLGADLAFTVENNHMADVELDEDALGLLLAEVERDGTGAFVPAFKDVTDMRKIPENEWQKRWRPRGLPDARAANAVVNEPGVAPSGASVANAGTTATGGSGTGGVGPGGPTA